MNLLERDAVGEPAVNRADIETVALRKALGLGASRARMARQFLVRETCTGKEDYVAGSRSWKADTSARAFQLVPGTTPAAIELGIAIDVAFSSPNGGLEDISDLAHDRIVRRRREVLQQSAEL